mgnify:CR=1 FL=1
MKPWFYSLKTFTYDLQGHMRIVQTYFSQSNIDERSGNWLNQTSNLACWALSCLMLIRHYGNVILYTDSLGADLLVDKCGLPYDAVHTVFDDCDIRKRIQDGLWVLSKIYTYSLQEEPFVHVDGDFLLWNKIDINHDIIFQNLEIDVDLYYKTYRNLSDRYGDLELTFADCLRYPYINKASNMGFFGGKNISFINEYANSVIDFSQKIEQLSYRCGDLDYNCFLEQYYFHYLCRIHGIEYSTLTKPCYSDFKRNAGIRFNIPNPNIPFNHFLGTGKKNEIANDFVKSILKVQFPEYYGRIESLCAQDHSVPYFFNYRNEKFRPSSICSMLESRLKGYNIILDDELKADFTRYIDIIDSLVSVADKRRIDFDGQYDIPEKEDYYIRYSANFIGMHRFLLPWNTLLYDNSNFREEDICAKNVRVLRTGNIKDAPQYCVFSYTPFDSTVSSLWLNRETAYMLCKFLTREYQPVSFVIKSLCDAIGKESGNEKRQKSIKLLLTEILKEIRCYEIIEFKEII